MLSTLRIASDTLHFSVLLLNPGMVPHLIYPTYVFLAPLSITARTPGARPAKLDRHTYDGIFLGYSGSD